MEISGRFLVMLTEVVIIIAAEKTAELDVNFQQHDYHLMYERMELVRYNQDYIRNMSVVTFKYNRTQPVTNLTFTTNIDLGYDAVWLLQAYKFMSNEYRLFPMRFSTSVCKTLTVNTGGIRRILACGNFTGCPMLKGKRHHICNFFPDEKRLPPFVPNGSYKMEIQMLYFAKEVFVVDAYVSITRPLQWHV